MDDVDGGVNAYIRADESLFQVVEEFVVYFAFTGYRPGNFPEEPLFCFLQAVVELFLLLAAEEFLKKSHISES